MKILVVGIGGVGGFISSMLTHKYNDVTLVARGNRYLSIKDQGLIMHSDLHGEMISFPNVVRDPKEAGLQDYIFICVKNYSLLEVLEQIEPCLKEDTIVIPVLNGVDHGEVCENHLSKGKVVDSLIYITSFFNKDYSITQQGSLAYLYVGGEEEEANKKVSELLNKADIECRLTDDIEKELWRKYLVNCAFNTLTAYYGCPIGEIRNDPKRNNEYRMLLEECFSVAKGKGVHLDHSIVDRLYQSFDQELPGDITSSLARDIEAHHQNEMETFVGYVDREARLLNIEVPTIHHFYQELKKLS